MRIQRKPNHREPAAAVVATLGSLAPQLVAPLRPGFEMLTIVDDSMPSDQGVGLRMEWPTGSFLVDTSATERNLQWNSSEIESAYTEYTEKVSSVIGEKVQDMCSDRYYFKRSDDFNFNRNRDNLPQLLKNVETHFGEDGLLHALIRSGGDEWAGQFVGILSNLSVWPELKDCTVENAKDYKSFKVGIIDPVRSQVNRVLSRMEDGNSGHAVRIGYMLQRHCIKRFVQNKMESKIPEKPCGDDAMSFIDTVHHAGWLKSSLNTIKQDPLIDWEKALHGTGKLTQAWKAFMTSKMEIHRR